MPKTISTVTFGAWIAVLIYIAATYAVPYQHLEYAPWSTAMMHGIQGADVIRAISLNQEGTPYLSTERSPGQAGSAMVTSTPNPPAFFINSGRLYVYINDTAVMAVNVHEPKTESLPASTGSAQQPLTKDTARAGLYNLMIEEKRGGIEGEWYYVGSSLHFAKTRLPPPLKKGSSVELGSKRIWRNDRWTLLPENNDGVYWQCELRPSVDNIWGRMLYLDFYGYDYEKRPAPEHCAVTTLRSWGQNN
ncbi:hypothetical protein FRB96_008721 [Tulasnella sp. 330]|nr:hypothetical protein FRB96_008721 [Tulasnella sp. 330]KAG8881793.1 hypothetical protein FRB97_009128 [Tulasnella sp. 331]KAG8887788.1 hypothetical protein FRB98_009048 [Tulasnella sp. 332]